MINRRKCSCGRLCIVSRYGKIYNWICALCKKSFPFTESEIVEYEQHRKEMVNTKVNRMKDDRKKLEINITKLEDKASTTAEIVDKLANGKGHKDIIKDLKVNNSVISKVAKEEAKTIDEMKEFLVRENLDVAKKAHEILKEDEYEKLKSLDAYRLVLASKIAGQGAIEMGGGHLQNVNVINLQALVEKVNLTEKNSEIQKEIHGKEKKEPIEDAEIK